ncbi:uncharacterized protein BcabD6B2_34640 [Babesia caballi]|uniref:Secreted protein n=1 Tax=Babesia caballi TaxID=5871 RepID=A0AAV4LVE3_BABCB|nr:hypothetical protein BcabD6B2_34640 [Babesia caballi]
MFGVTWRWATRYVRWNGTCCHTLVPAFHVSTTNGKAGALLTTHFSSVVVAFLLVRAVGSDAHELALPGGGHRQLYVERLEVVPRDGFVERLGELVDAPAVGVGVPVLPELEQAQRLVGEGGRHDEGRVAVGAAEVVQPAEGEDNHAPAGVGELEVVGPGLDVGDLQTGHLVELGHLDLLVALPDVAEDGVVLHAPHVLYGDGVNAAGAGDENVRSLDDVVHVHDVEPLHSSLQRTDGVDFRDFDLGALPPEALRNTLSDVAVADDDHGFAADDEAIGAVEESVDARVPAPVDVVVLLLSHAVVGAHDGEEKATGLPEFAELSDATGSLLREAGHLRRELLPEVALLHDQLVEQPYEALHVTVVLVEVLRVQKAAVRGVSLLQVHTVLDHGVRTAPVVDDEIGSVHAGPAESLVHTPPVLLHGLTCSTI